MANYQSKICLTHRNTTCYHQGGFEETASVPISARSSVDRARAF
jgi:D-arabinose 1-dehydrogenase-like Zn-dependent alcohol dehydrogenase